MFGVSQSPRPRLVVTTGNQPLSPQAGFGPPPGSFSPRAPSPIAAERGPLIHEQKGRDGSGMDQKFAVVCSFIIMIASNVLSFRGVFGDTDVGAVSNDNPTYVTPDGMTFSVWGVIYFLHLIFVVAQCMPSPEAEALLSREPCVLTELSVRSRVSAAFLLNAVWLPAYTNEFFVVSLIFIGAYLLLLVSCVITINARTTTNFVHWALFAAPLSVNASWILVATIANVFTVAGQNGWVDAYGVYGSVRAAGAVVIVVMVIGCAMAVLMFDLGWSLVAAWALRGIYRAQSIPSEAFPIEAMSDSLAFVANWASIVTVVISEVGLVITLYFAYVNSNSPPRPDLVLPPPRTANGFGMLQHSPRP